MQGMAGNIIHAIATTNAIIAGLIVVAAMQILAGCLDLCKARCAELTRPGTGHVPAVRSCFVCPYFNSSVTPPPGVEVHSVRPGNRCDHSTQHTPLTYRTTFSAPNHPIPVSTLSDAAILHRRMLSWARRRGW